MKKILIAIVMSIFLFGCTQPVVEDTTPVTPPVQEVQEVQETPEVVEEPVTVEPQQIETAVLSLIEKTSKIKSMQ